MLLSFIFLLQVALHAQLLDIDPREQEFNKILSSFGNDYIGNVKTKYQQLFTNFHSQSLGRKTVFFASDDQSVCGQPLSDRNKIIASVEYGELNQETYRKEQLNFTGCDLRSNFAFSITRYGSELQRLKPEEFIEELEFLDLKPQEQRRTINFTQNGQRQYTIDIKKIDSKTKLYVYEFDGTRIFNAHKIEDDKTIKIEFNYSNLSSPFGEKLKRLSAQYDKQNKQTIYYWPNSNLKLSKRQFDSYVQQIIRSAISFFYAGLHEISLLMLPETEVVATTTSDSEFYRKLIEMLAILSSGQVNPVINFLNQTKADIENGVLIVTEN